MQQLLTTLGEFEMTDQELGAGTYGQVRVAKRRSDGRLCAIKSMYVEPDREKLFLREVSVPAHFRHPAILEIIGFVPPKDTHEGFVITPLMAHNSLDHHLMRHWFPNRAGKIVLDPEWTDVVCGKAAYGLAQALAFMHAHNTWHRDVKPANLLLDEHWNPRLSDFGLSRKVAAPPETEDLTVTHRVGSQLWKAPELDVEEEQYDSKVDVYAFGVTLYYMSLPQLELVMDVDGRHVQVYPGRPGQRPVNLKSLVAEGHRFVRLENIPDPVWELITQCWSHDPAQRPTMEEIVRRMRNPVFAMDPERADEYMAYVAWLDAQEKTYISSRATVQTKESTTPASSGAIQRPFRFVRK